MVKNGKNHLKLFIHKTGSAAQTKHDFILDQLFNGAPTDSQHLIKSLDLISKLDVDQDTKQNYYGVLINYASTGDKDAAKRGIYADAYVQAVIALDRALTPIWRADQTLLDVITLTIKTITARANYAAFITKQTINNHFIPFTFLDSLLTKIIPAHAPTAVQRDAA
jgi:hypothetical protein